MSTTVLANAGGLSVNIFIMPRVDVTFDSEAMHAQGSLSCTCAFLILNLYVNISYYLVHSSVCSCAVLLEVRCLCP